jgi:flagellar biosynthesis anti-sigma factor FlgM
MRIDSTSMAPIAPVSSNEPRAAKSDQAPAAAPAASVVQLSSAGATAAASGTSATSSAGLTQRLSTIKAQLGSGQYAVDLDRLANRIVDDESIRGRGKTS